MDTKNDAALISEVQTTLEQLNAESRGHNIEVEEQLRPNGQFKIVLAKGKMSSVISHGWNNQRVNYENPGTIDVMLFDLEKKEMYTIFMTECTLSDFPDLLKIAYKDMRLFFEGRYNIEQPKWWHPIKNVYAYMDNGERIYKHAKKSRHFLSTEEYVASLDDRH